MKLNFKKSKNGHVNLNEEIKNVELNFLNSEGKIEMGYVISSKGLYDILYRHFKQIDDSTELINQMLDKKPQNKSK